jgi:hypothetical protein
MCRTRRETEAAASRQNRRRLRGAATRSNRRRYTSAGDGAWIRGNEIAGVGA